MEHPRPEESWEDLGIEAVYEGPEEDAPKQRTSQVYFRSGFTDGDETDTPPDPPPT